jgi:hypothetical protein
MPLIEDTQRYINSISTHESFNGTTKRSKSSVNLRQHYLVETDIAGVLTEALTAQVELVLADQGSSLAADTAIHHKIKRKGDD